MHIRKFLAATALAVACMIAASTTAFAASVHVGSPTGSAAYSDAIVLSDGSLVVGSAVDVASVNAGDLPVIVPASLMASSCANGPAWMLTEQSDGAYLVERFPACSRRYDPGWRST